MLNILCRISTEKEMFFWLSFRLIKKFISVSFKKKVRKVVMKYVRSSNYLRVWMANFSSAYIMKIYRINKKNFPFSPLEQWKTFSFPSQNLFITSCEDFPENAFHLHDETFVSLRICAREGKTFSKVSRRIMILIICFNLIPQVGKLN